MSIRVMAVVWEFDLPATEKLVLLVIADHADDNGENAYPGVARIAKRASITERHARRVLHDLCDQGFLTIDRQRGGGIDYRNDRRPNRYRINGLTLASGRGLDGLTQASERPDMGVHHGLTPVSGNTSIEPSINNLSEIDARFDEFWASYPRKVGKRDALLVFRRLMRQQDAPDHGGVLEAVGRLSAENREIRYIPHPATWLRQGRWDDEYLPDDVSETPRVAPRPFCGVCEYGWVTVMEDGEERMAKCRCQL